jgi:hypothetical protein
MGATVSCSAKATSETHKILHALIYNGCTSYLAIGKTNLSADSKMVKPCRQGSP